MSVAVSDSGEVDEEERNERGNNIIAFAADPGGGGAEGSCEINGAERDLALLDATEEKKKKKNTSTKSKRINSR